jgi:transposase-like protein
MTHRTHLITSQHETLPDEPLPAAVHEALELLVEQGFDGLAQALELLLNEAMKIERTHALAGRPYERTPARRGQANGFKSKTVQTRVGPLELAVPQTRGVSFYPSALEKGQRSERALTLALAEMYLQGVSTRKVKPILEQLCGTEVTSSQVSRATQKLDTELSQWRERALGQYDYLLLDARYEHVRIAGNVQSCALLIAIGITEGRRSVIGVGVSLSEAEVHWRDFLASLQERGLHGVKLIVSDDHAGLEAARQSRFVGVPWQRCQFHLGQNLLDHIPQGVSQAEASAELRSVFNAPNRDEADRQLERMVKKYKPLAPKLAAWLEANVPDGLAVFSVPANHRRKLRTNNCPERLNREIKRRTRVASVFPNEASLLRLATALLMETDEEWQSERRYLPKAAT